eukprot:1161180-Pelagomonas_calceolata.AAC.8
MPHNAYHAMKPATTRHTCHHAMRACHNSTCHDKEPRSQSIFVGRRVPTQTRPNTLQATFACGILSTACYSHPCLPSHRMGAGGCILAFCHLYPTCHPCAGAMLTFSVSFQF